MRLESEEQIKDIPIEKKSKNIWIVLLKDLGDITLYLNKSDNCFSGFEVHKIRIMEKRECDITRKDGSIYHMLVQRRRIIAGSEDFGRYAWHYPNLNIVYEKYPEFKKHNKEIETRLQVDLESTKKPVLSYEVDKTNFLNDSHHSLKD